MPTMSHPFLMRLSVPELGALKEEQALSGVPMAEIARRGIRMYLAKKRDDRNRLEFEKAREAGK